MGRPRLTKNVRLRAAQRRLDLRRSDDVFGGHRLQIPPQASLADSLHLTPDPGDPIQLIVQGACPAAVMFDLSHDYTTHLFIFELQSLKLRAAQRRFDLRSVTP